MSALADSLQKALRHHRAGELECAEQIYHEIVRVDPQHSDALHLLGVAAHQRGDNRTAVDCISRAVRVNSSDSSYYSNLGAAFRALDQFAEAADSFREAIRLTPSFAGAHYNLGLAVEAQGLFDEAIASYWTSLQLDPDFAPAWNNLGSILESRQNYSEANECYRNAIRISPDFVAARYNLANSLHKSGKYEAAIDEFREALQHAPDIPQIHNNLGTLYQALGEFETAADCFRRAIEINPNFAEAHNNLGAVLQQRGQIDKAVTCCERAIEIDPEFACAHYNLGNLFSEEDDWETAVPCYRRAIKLDPSSAETYNNLGNALSQQSLFDKAVTCWDRAIEIDPQHAEAHLHRAATWLRNGDFAIGWTEYDWRWKQTNAKRRRFECPEWDGSSLAGRSILVHAEQGVGDEIMFASCIGEIAKQADRCIVECDIRLLPIFQRSFPSAECLPTPPNENSSSRSTLADIDVEISVGSLPRFLRTNLQQFPRMRSYLQADPQLCHQWQRRIQKFGRSLKVGISWRGGSKPEVARRKSTTLEQWSPILAIPGITFINLQYGSCAEEIQQIRSQTGIEIHDWPDSDPIDDLDDFAAKVASVDLMISTSNAAVHMAAALGVPVWTLLPDVADWRWMRDRQTSPWYPTMRLFRQTRSSRWEEPFEQVARLLYETVARRGETNSTV